MRVDKLIEQIKQNKHYIYREYYNYQLYELHSDTYIYNLYFKNGLRVQTSRVLLSTHNTELDYLQLGLQDTSIVFNHETGQIVSSAILECIDTRPSAIATKNKETEESKMTIETVKDMLFSNFVKYKDDIIGDYETVIIKSKKINGDIAKLETFVDNMYITTDYIKICAFEKAITAIYVGEQEQTLVFVKYCKDFTVRYKLF